MKTTSLLLSLTFSLFWGANVYAAVPMAKTENQSSSLSISHSSNSGNFSFSPTVERGSSDTARDDINVIDLEDTIKSGLNGETD